MGKTNKSQIKNAKLNRLKGPKKGKISKLAKKSNGPIKNGKGNERRRARDRPDINVSNDDDSIVVKKRPSKVELKSVIEALQKDATLLLVRKALKYVPFYLKSEGLTKKLLKEIITLWAEATEKIRVICLLCLIRIYTKLKEDDKKQLVIKKLYTTFLEKCRVTKQETMSMIGFMRHSIIELYKIDPNIAYKQAQTSCQQLVITLKNAQNHKNEETYKSVLNWQFANCLILLSQLITSVDDKSPIRSLLQQVIQLNLGAINLLISPRYYPFYCHLIENLVHLSITTQVFVPILPLVLNILKRLSISPERKVKPKEVNDKKTNGKVKENGHDEEDDQEEDEDDDEEEEDEDEDYRKDKPEKPPKEYNIELLNHVSLDEAHQPNYQEAVLNKLYELMLLYLSSQNHKIAFPELVFLPCVQLKKWLKLNSGQSTLKFKTLLEKIKSDCEKIEDERRSVKFNFTDYNAVDAWEKKLVDSNKLSLRKLMSNNNNK